MISSKASKPSTRLRYFVGIPSPKDLGHCRTNITHEILKVPMSLPHIQPLRTSFAGELIQPADAGYASACKIWNASIQKRPVLIARCTGVSDVVAAVNFARENSLLTAVRGGGHNVGGRALCDDGIVIDLSAMRGVYVDPAKRTDRAQGG